MFDLLDERLNARGESCLGVLSENPGLSFPDMFARGCDLVGFYRFLENERFDYTDLIGEIEDQAFESLQASETRLAIHDTTQVVVKGLAAQSDSFSVKPGRSKAGFFSHMSLLCEPKTRRVFGVGKISIWTRGSGVKEAPRWMNHVKAIEENSDVGTTVHLMDREGDSYDTIARLAEDKLRFVVRVAHKDRLLSESENFHNLQDKLGSLEFIVKREVSLSSRKGSVFEKASKINPPRTARIAKLSLSATSVSIKKSERIKDKSLADDIEINVVKVLEADPPEGVKPVEWVLFTQEPIKTTEDVEQIVDYYRQRWIIEDYFKCLKTGCKLEERRVESAEAWLKMFVLFIPAAVQLINLRTVPDQNIKKSQVFTGSEKIVLKILSKRFKISLKTLKDAQLIIARLGGYNLYRKEPPGWQILHRGLKKLHLLAEGLEMQ